MKDQIFKGIKPHVGTEILTLPLRKKRITKKDILFLKKISQRARKLEEKYADIQRPREVE